MRRDFEEGCPEAGILLRAVFEGTISAFTAGVEMNYFKRPEVNGRGSENAAKTRDWRLHRLFNPRPNPKAMIGQAVARYLHRIGDGASFGYIDEDGGPDKMLYTRDGTWLGFITDDGGSVIGPDGVPLFSIADGYFYDASGAALLYLGEAEEETEEEEAISADPEVVQYEEGMRGYLVRIAKSIGTKPIIFTPAQVEIILNAAQTLNVFGHTDFFYRVVGCLRETTDVDDTAVRHAAEQARQEFQQQQPQD